MTKADRINLLNFILYTGMYVNPVDEKSIISFIHGYELGTKHKCDFTQLIKHLIAHKYKIKHSSDGWEGQITRRAETLSLSWVATFKMTAMEIVAGKQHGGLNAAMAKALKTNIESLFGRIDCRGDSWFNESWIEGWLSLSMIKSKLFRPLWDDDEWTVIGSVIKLVQAKKIFGGNDSNNPMPELIKLKDQFHKAKKYKM
jgi:hypothetical protein